MQQNKKKKKKGKLFLAASLAAKYPFFWVFGVGLVLWLTDRLESTSMFFGGHIFYGVARQNFYWAVGALIFVPPIVFWVCRWLDKATWRRFTAQLIFFFTLISQPGGWFLFKIFGGIFFVPRLACVVAVSTWHFAKAITLWLAKKQWTSWMVPQVVVLFLTHKRPTQPAQPASTAPNSGSLSLLVKHVQAWACLGGLVAIFLAQFIHSELGLSLWAWMREYWLFSLLVPMLLGWDHAKKVVAWLQSYPRVCAALYIGVCVAFCFAVACKHPVVWKPYVLVAGGYWLFRVTRSQPQPQGPQQPQQSQVQGPPRPPQST